MSAGDRLVRVANTLHVSEQEVRALASQPDYRALYLAELRAQLDQAHEEQMRAAVREASLLVKLYADGEQV